MKSLAVLMLVLAGPFAGHGIAVAAAPAVATETFVPGYTIPHASQIAVDAAGSAYLIGSAYADGQHLDVLVIKVDPDGNVAWTRYVNGGGHDYATDLAVDSAGDVWVTGWTDSAAFPIVGGLDATLTGFRDAFLMKLSAADGSIQYSTFLGGDYTDAASGIALGDDDAIYLTGYTGSTDFPTTPDAYQPGPGFPEYFYQDAFVAKLAPGGGAILYATYFGGTHDDWGDRIALDGDGNIIVVGHTDADDLPLVNAVDSAPNDLFVSKLSADGGTLLFSTYLGGADREILRDMAGDDAGNVYLVGNTRSTDFPTTAGAYQATFVGAVDGCGGGGFGNPVVNCDDFFVCKLATDGGGLQWGTYLGGSNVDEPRSLAVDAGGNVYVAGYTTSGYNTPSDFPLVTSGFSAQIVVARLSGDGAALDFVHSVDSGSANRGNGVAVGAGGAVYFSGTVGVPADVYVCRLQQESIQATAAGDQALPSRLQLNGNHPNPFNPSTTITYAIPAGAGARPVHLDVYDVGGRLVRRLVDQMQEPGEYAVSWRGRDQRGAPVAAGVYRYRLAWGATELVRSMVLLK